MNMSEEKAPAAHPLTLRGAQEAVDAWIGQFKEGYWPPLANLARLMEEVGELARELNHRYGPKKKKPTEPEQDLALELADILFVIITIANEQGIDLEEAFTRVLEKYRIRDSDRWER
jgi:NTP pyrophosphatase (non-canonical NTP hydrolase)